jgi:spoIIIJ-associated protein
MNDWVEYTGKTVNDAITEATIALNTTSDNIEYEVIEKESNGILNLFGKKDARIRVRLKNGVADNAYTFLNNVFKAMNIDSNIDIEYDEETGSMNITLSGDEMGILIGKRGQTLDSLQYLTSLVVNKEAKGYVKVKLDTENYRERRKETLENLAMNIARKVKKTRSAVILEPMNPYERRIIHSALQGDKYVDTHSEGDEPYRKVVVTPKKGAFNDSYSGGYRKRGYKNNRYNKNNRKYSNSESDTQTEKVETSAEE